MSGSEEEALRELGKVRKDECRTSVFGVMKYGSGYVFLFASHITLTPPTYSRKCYRHEGELHLDVGPFMSALEYATGVQAEVIGKPEKEFFKVALSDLGVSAGEVSW